DQRVDRLEPLICSPRPRSAMPLGRAAASSCGFANLCLTLQAEKGRTGVDVHHGQDRQTRLTLASGSARTWRSSMQTPVEIEFQGLKGNDQLGACVMKNVSVLEQRFGRITACRVVIKAASERHRTGGACEITIRLSLPQGREVDIGRSEKAERTGDRLAD